MIESARRNAERAGVAARTDARLPRRRRRASAGADRPGDHQPALRPPPGRRARRGPRLPRSRPRAARALSRLARRRRDARQARWRASAGRSRPPRDFRFATAAWRSSCTSSTSADAASGAVDLTLVGPVVSTAGAASRASIPHAAALESEPRRRRVEQRVGSRRRRSPRPARARRSADRRAGRRASRGSGEGPDPPPAAAPRAAAPRTPAFTDPGRRSEHAARPGCARVARGGQDLRNVLVVEAGDDRRDVDADREPGPRQRLDHAQPPRRRRDVGLDRPRPLRIPERNADRDVRRGDARQLAAARRRRARSAPTW